MLSDLLAIAIKKVEYKTNILKNWNCSVGVIIIFNFSQVDYDALLSELDDAENILGINSTPPTPEEEDIFALTSTPKTSETNLEAPKSQENNLESQDIEESHFAGASINQVDVFSKNWVSQFWILITLQSRPS